MMFVPLVVGVGPGVVSLVTAGGALAVCWFRVGPLLSSPPCTLLLESQWRWWLAVWLSVVRCSAVAPLSCVRAPSHACVRTCLLKAVPARACSLTLRPAPHGAGLAIIGCPRCALRARVQFDVWTPRALAFIGCVPTPSLGCRSARFPACALTSGLTNVLRCLARVRGHARLLLTGDYPKTLHRGLTKRPLDRVGRCEAGGVR